MAMRVVIAGGGVAGLEAALALHGLAGHRLELTLIAPDEDFHYRPLSVGEPFALGPAQRVPLEQVARDTGLKFRQESLAAVDAEAHTVAVDTGSEVVYDRLIVALGAERVPAFERAITFRGQEDSERLHGLVLDVEEDYSHQITFVVPTGVAWSLPLYELALMTARRAREMNVRAEVALVTPETRPLQVFGTRAAADVEGLLAAAGIRLYPGQTAQIPAKGRVELHPSGATLRSERIVALPQIRGRAVDGLPADRDGFIPVDAMMRVEGLDDVYAVGDGTTFPLKQGGIACQQADVAARDIARAAGVPVETSPFKPVLRGQLLTGGKPHFMRREIGSPSAERDRSGEELLWWPPAKVAGEYLAPYLAARERQEPSDVAVAVADALEQAQPLDLGAFKFAER